MSDAVPPERQQDASTPGEAALVQLSEVLVNMEETPDSVPLIRRQISLMLQLGMQAEALDAYSRLSSLVMLDETTWLSYFDTLISSAAQPLSLDSFIDILEKFDQAEKDYYSMPVLLRHQQFVLSCHKAAGADRDVDHRSSASSIAKVDADVAEFVNAETTRGMLAAIMQKGQGSLSESDSLWQPWLEWETEFIEDISEREDAIVRIDAMYQDRLRTPHTNLESTSSAYSTFCSTYSPDDYEAKMIQATETSQTAKTKYSREKRYGKTREDLEQQLAYSTDLASRIQTLMEYSSWESDARARTGGRNKSPTVDHHLTSTIFEKTVAEYAKAAAYAYASVDAAEASVRELSRQSTGKGKGKQRSHDGSAELVAAKEGLRVASETVRAYKDAEASIWQKYCEWTEQNEASADALTAIFERALSLGLLQFPEGHTADIVSLFLCRTASECRTVSIEEATAVHPVLATLMRGMETVYILNKGGDTTFKLEKSLLVWAETRAPEFLDQALQLLDQPNKARSASYQMTLLRADVLMRSGRLDEAREVFNKAIQRTDLDWPEAVYDGFIQFENIHGTLKSLLETNKKIDREREKLTRRREKQALEAQQLQETYQVGQTAVVAAAAEAQNVSQEAAVQPVAAETPQVPAASTQASTTNFTRDREHTTVLVTGLPKQVTVQRIQAFFTECGTIRETTLVSNDDSVTDAALVEFAQADAVPAALAKDRKKLDGSEVAISMLWRSTLFVTNFARELDDEALRSLFGQYGKILQTRWPSRKYADSRRFCYITMESPAAAQEALILHGYKTGDTGFGLTVLVSDPSVKAKRSDANNSTLFVGGLNNKTTESDVQALLRPHATIRNLKLGWNPEKGICKGFAFVEVATEAEAKACIVLHGTQFQGRYLKVELSDPNHANKKPINKKRDEAEDRRGRLVRMSNLPDDAQEGLLQQALEKVIPVKRLEMFTKTHEAVAELESQADAGKLVLGGEPFVFGGKEIVFTEQTQQRSAPETITNTSFAPRAARKGKVLAKPRPVTIQPLASGSASASASGSTSTTAKPTGGQDDFRALVAAKNRQREEKLADAKGEKRKVEGEHEDHDNDVKRTRT